MKKNLVPSLVLSLGLSLSVLVPSAAAQNSSLTPTGTCPTGFMIHEYEGHMMDDHMHAGLTVDLNGNGYICVKHVTDTIHVHVDDMVKP